MSELRISMEECGKIMSSAMLLRSFCRVAPGGSHQIHLAERIQDILNRAATRADAENWRNSPPPPKQSGDGAWWDPIPDRPGEYERRTTSPSQ